MSKGLVLIDQQTKNTLTVTIRYTRFILPLFDLKVLSSHSIHQDQNTPIITYKKKQKTKKQTNTQTNKQTTTQKRDYSIQQKKKKKKRAASGDGAEGGGGGGGGEGGTKSQGHIKL